MGKGEKKHVHERQWTRHGHVWWRRRVAEAERRVRGRNGRGSGRIQMRITEHIVNGTDGIRMGCGTRCGRWNGQNGKLDVIGYVQDSPEYPRRRADCTSPRQTRIKRWLLVCINPRLSPFPLPYVFRFMHNELCMRYIAVSARNSRPVRPPDAQTFWELLMVPVMMY